MSIDTVCRSGTDVFVPGTHEWMIVVHDLGFGYAMREDGILHIPFASETAAQRVVKMLNEAYPPEVRS